MQSLVVKLRKRIVENIVSEFRAECDPAVCKTVLKGWLGYKRDFGSSALRTWLLRTETGEELIQRRLG